MEFIQYLVLELLGEKLRIGMTFNLYLLILLVVPILQYAYHIRNHHAFLHISKYKISFTAWYRHSTQRRKLGTQNVNKKKRYRNYRLRLVNRPRRSAARHSKYREKLSRPRSRVPMQTKYKRVRMQLPYWFSRSMHQVEKEYEGTTSDIPSTTKNITWKTRSYKEQSRSCASSTTSSTSLAITNSTSSTTSGSTTPSSKLPCSTIPSSATASSAIASSTTLYSDIANWDIPSTNSDDVVILSKKLCTSTSYTGSYEYKNEFIKIIFRALHIVKNNMNEKLRIIKTNINGKQPFLCCITDAMELTINHTVFDSDSFPIRIDNCCSRSISFSKQDFDVNTLVKAPLDMSIKGFGDTSTPIMHIGTIVWRILDDKDIQRTIRIPNSFHVPTAKVRLLSPQHWAQESDDNVPKTRGTWCATYNDGVVIYTGINRPNPKQLKLIVDNQIWQFYGQHRECPHLEPSSTS
jgi:hypothetical protein